MKEILKRNQPPFKVIKNPRRVPDEITDFNRIHYRFWIVDENEYFICATRFIDVAQEIAAALNKAVTWNAASTPTGKNFFEDTWIYQQKEKMSQEEFKRLYECNWECEEPNKSARPETLDELAAFSQTIGMYGDQKLTRKN